MQSARRPLLAPLPIAVPGEPAGYELHEAAQALGRRTAAGIDRLDRLLWHGKIGEQDLQPVRGQSRPQDEAGQGHNAEPLDRDAAEEVAIVRRELRVDRGRHPFAVDAEPPDAGGRLIAVDEANMAGKIAG